MLLRLRFLLWVLTGLFFFSASPAFSQFANEEAVKKQADKYFDDEEYESCYKLYTQLVSLHQKDPELNYKLGVCMLFMEPNKKKCYPYLELANKSLKDCPKEARFYLGKAYHLNFKFDEAMKNYAQYKDMGSVAMVKKLQVDQEIEACKNGKRLLSNLTELIVSEKKLLSRADYFRSYNLSDIGGKLLVKPLEFISVLDKKKKNQSIIYLPKSNDQLYYASYGENPDNGKDLFVVKKLPDGEWSKPQNIGSPINTPFDEDYPFLHPNGKVLYFASKGHNSMGGYDIFKSELDEATGKWKAPVNMDFPINTPDDDILFVTDSLEKTAYFSSARSSPIGKIDVYKINTERRPMDFAYIKGTVVKKQPEQSILSKISIKNVDNGEDIGNYAANDSGQYSLQLPNGGKLLFTVETPGFTTQSEGVNLPQATTLKPYRQLIYYENKKLVIQNLFDQNINSDDAYLQYLDLIEQKSKLDVNADDFPVANNNTPVAANNTVKNNTDTSKTGSAKNTLNNEDLVKMAYKDAGELESESAQLKSEAGDAFTFANNKNVEAENKNKAATQAMEKANTEPDAKIKEQFVAEANKLKEEAETSSKNALLANNIAKQLEVDASNKKKEADLTLNYAKQLEEANKAKNNKEVLAKLESVQKELEDLSKTNTTNTNSLTNSIKVEAERKQEELKKAQAAIDKLKKDQENNTKEIAAIDKEIASTSDKDLIANYKAQQEDLKADVESSKKEITNTENKVAVLKKETELLQSQADFVSTMLTTVKGETAVATNNTTAKDPLNTTNNNTTTTNNNTGKDPLNNTATTTANNTSTKDYAAENKQLDQQLTALNSAPETADNYNKKNEILNNYINNINKEIASQKETLAKTQQAGEKNVINNNIKSLEQQKNQKSAELIKNTDKLAGIGNTTNTTVATNNTTTKDTANKTNTAVPANYTAASKQYDQELTALNNAPETADKYNKQNEIINNYIKSIDKEIAIQQETLAKTQQPGEKTVINNNIKNLEQQKNQKSAELIRNTDKLASIGTSTNTNVASNNNTTKDTANKTSATVPANYTDASKQYDQQLAALNNTTETTDTYTKKNEVLNNYVESIDKEITTQQEALTKTDKQSEKTAIANNIKNLEQQKTEKSNEIAANNTKLSSLNNTTNNIVANNTVTTNDTANKTNTAVPANYTDASKQYDQQLAALNNTAETTDTYTRKNEVLNNYVKSIDKEISTQQEALTKAQKKSEKTAIANNIKNLEQQKTEKSNEIIANNTKLASLNNTTNNTLTTNNTTTKDTLTNTALATNNTASKDSSNKNSAQSAAEHEQLLQEINGIKNSNSLTFNKDESLFFTNVVYNDQQALSIKQQVDEKLARLKTVENTVGQKINQLENSIKNGSSANSTDQSIHDLSKRADQLNDEALELRKASASYSGTQKEEAIAKIASLEKEAEDLRLKSVEDQWSLYQQQYATNNMNLNTLSGLSEKNQHEDIVQANLLAGDSKTFQAQADKMRGDSKAESSTASKTAALTNANDKLLVAITKQNQSIELYKKHNPGFQPAANTAVASNHKAEVEEIKKQIADGVVIKHDILKTLSDANKAEYNALLAKLNQLEKTNPGANPEAKNLKAAAQKNLIEANALLIKVNNTTNEVEKKGFYVDANKYLSEGINNLNKAIALVQPAVVTNVNTNNNETKTETKTVLVDPVTTNTTNTTAPVKDKNEPTPEQLAKLKNTPQYKTYQNLKTEADKLNVVAETENVKAQEYYDIAIKHLKESTDLRIKADTLPEGTEKDQIQRNAIELDRIANINKAKGDSLHELSNNTKAFAASKIEEANAIIGPLAKNNTTSAVVVANNNVKENNNTANSNTASSNKSNTENYIKGKGFEITKGNAYSDAKPVPMDEKLPDGLIFRVQIGAFKKALPNESFKGLSPVGGERTASGLIRYQVGLFDQFDNANAVKNDMKGIGYKDAFVVAYKDGKRINMNDAFNELKNQGIAVNPSNNSTAGIKNNANVPVAASGEATATNSNPVNVTSELSSMQGMLFTVQIGVYNSQLKSSQLNNLEPIYREKLSGGLYRYTAGVYSNIDRVKADKAKVNALGMRDAFVSAYFNGEKIKINEALSKINSGEKLSFPAENPIRFNGQAAVLPESSPLNPTSNTNPVATAVSPFSNGVSEGPAPTAENGVKVGEEGISYKVQIGAYRNQVPQNVAGNFMKIKTWPIKYLRVNDLFVYTIGSFTDVKNAKKLQQEAVSNGITDAFITVFKDGKKLFGTEAGKYLNQ